MTNEPDRSDRRRTIAMSTPTTPETAAGLATGTWRLDPSRSSAEFQVPMLGGLMTAKGHFDRYQGTLNVSGRPAVALVVDADSLDTRNKRRDKHLRSSDFFDVANHPQVRFEADAADFHGGTLKVRGLLYAAGAHVPVDVDATVSQVGDEFEIEAIALVDQRELGMTFSPLGVIRASSKLIIRGRLVRGELS
jgi:polyisoprenoid-binding protein YceI